MSYCLSPVCSVPTNLATDSCQNCGMTLKLCNRYQALKPIGQGGFGRTFLAVDLSQTMKPRCVITGSNLVCVSHQAGRIPVGELQ